MRKKSKVKENIYVELVFTVILFLRLFGAFLCFYQAADSVARHREGGMTHNKGVSAETVVVCFNQSTTRAINI